MPSSKDASEFTAPPRPGPTGDQLAPSHVAIPLTTVPPAGTAAELTVRVGGVPGEKNLDNNRQTYTVLFGS